jgi:hypothetical protein
VRETTRFGCSAIQAVLSARCGPEILVVGFVEHDEHVLRHRCDERAQRLGRDPRARRIVRIGDEHDARLRRDRPAHRREVVRVVACRHLDPGRAARLCGKRVHDERVPRVDGVVARPQKSLRRELEHVVRSVAEDELEWRDAQPCRRRRLQLEAVATRIPADLVGCGGNRGAHPGARPSRILVRRELHDVARGEAEFAGKLGDRLSRHVPAEISHILRGEERRVDRVMGNRRGAHATPNKSLKDMILTV